MAGGYQEEDRRLGEQQAATALPRPPLQPSVFTPRSLFTGANSPLFSAFSSQPAPTSPQVVSPAPASEVTPLVGVDIQSTGGPVEERRRWWFVIDVLCVMHEIDRPCIDPIHPYVDNTGARSPLSSVMLILGVVFLFSSGAIAALTRSHPREGPSTAPADLQLKAEGPEEGALTREGASWKLPSLRFGTHAPSPAPTPAPTVAPTGRSDQGFDIN